MLLVPTLSPGNAVLFAPAYHFGEEQNLQAQRLQSRGLHSNCECASLPISRYVNPEDGKRAHHQLAELGLRIIQNQIVK